MEALLNRLREAGIQVWVEGEKLRYKAPPGALTPELAAQVKGSRDELIAWLHRAQEQGAQHEAIPLADRNGPLPLHPAQERLWFLDRYEGGRSAAYNIPLAFRLEGRLDIPHMRHAFETLCERHEVTRTSFTMDEHGARQVIHPAASFPLSFEVVDVEEADLAKVMAQQAEELFDLEKPPLLRVRVYCLGPDDHVLMVVLHHVIGDGWSRSVYLRDVAELYAASIDGRPPALPELPVAYADVAAWLRSRDFGPQLAYWKKKLAHLVDLDFPTDRVRPAMKTYAGDRFTFTIHEEVQAGLERLAREQQATLFMVLCGACSLLLGRYSNKEDVVIGTPVAGRTREEVRDLAGLFVNTLALRTDLSGNPSFETYLGRMRETCLEAYANQDLPFEQVVQALDVQRDPGRTPVFQVMCVMQEAGEGDLLRIPAGKVTELPVQSDTAKFDLAFTFVRTVGGALTCQLEYNTDLFTRERMERMQGHLESLLRVAATQPSLPIQEMPMLTPEEHDLMVRDWNRIDPPFVVEQTIQAVFEEQAARFPERIAVTCGQRSLTYAELNERANQVAHTIRDQYQKLHGRAMEADELIGICVERDLEMVVGIFGILKAGGAYVPMDPRYPAARLRFMATDAQCSIILTQQSCLEQMLFMTEGDFGVISLDGGWPVIARAPRHNPEPINGPEHLAYVIYTSGSTGKPKGVLIPHGNVIRLFMACDRHYAFSEHDVWTCFHSYAFDFSVWEIYGALLKGGRLVVVPYYVSRDPEQFVDLVYQEGVTVLSQTPSAFYHFAETVLRSERTTTPLRYVVYGGEALDIHRLRAWWDRFDPCAPQLVNMYGITETTVHSTFLALSPADLERKHVYSPIGTRLHDLAFYVLDAHRNPVPIAVPGELYLGGAGVARGYFHRPELNRERFIPNRFVEGTPPVDVDTDAEPPVGPNPRLYKSGDVVRWMADGTLEYVGRNDFQVKIRGFRIELGEIEAVLMRHPAVAECIVLAREIEGQQHLVAWYAPKRDGERPTTQALRTHLGKDLAEYMVPSFFVEVEQLPLTEQGKIDRRALPAPRVDELVSRSEFVAPTTEAERVLVEIFEQLFKTTGIGVLDNFFSLGGNSLTSIQVVYRAREKGLSLTLKDIFTHPTIAELAQCCQAAPTIAAEQGPVRGSAPLTPIQSWFLERDLPAAAHFNLAFSLASRVPWEEDVMRRALDAVLAHHDALRLRFRKSAHGWEQHFSDAAEAWHVPFEVLTVPPQDAPAFIEAQGTRMQEALDLEQGPLVRALLLNGHPDGRQRLLLVAHHLVMDSVSLGIVLRDLQAACEQLAQGLEVRLPAKTTSFRDWSLALLRYADTKAVRDSWPFWAQVGAGATPTHVDHPAGEVTVAQARSLETRLHASWTRRLVAVLAQVEGPSVQDLLLAALLQAWHGWCGARDLLLHIEGHGREDCVEGVDVSRTVGWFTSLFPVHLKRPAGDDALALVRAVGETVRAIPDGGLSHGVLRHLGTDEQRQALERLDTSRVGFNYLGQSTMDEADACFVDSGDGCGPESSLRNPADQWLDITCLIQDDSLACNFMYSTVHYDGPSVQRLASGFEEAVKRLVACCEEARAAGTLPTFAAVTKTRAAHFQPVMSFHEDGERPPLVFMHPGQGGAEVYLHFTTLLDAAQPFHAIESYNLYGPGALLAGIEAMAANYIGQLKRVQPRGPYRLGGWCLGGLLAIEMAHQLGRAGERVEVIYMIDSFAFGPRQREQVARFTDRCLLEDFLQLDPLYHQFPEAYRKRVIDASLQEYADLSVYVPRRYEGDVVLFKATQAMPMPEGVDPTVREINLDLDQAMIPSADNGWGAVLPRLQVVTMEAHHHSIMEGECIRSIAEYIERDLARRRGAQEEAVATAPVGGLGGRPLLPRERPAAAAPQAAWVADASWRTWSPGRNQSPPPRR